MRKQYLFTSLYEYQLFFCKFVTHQQAESKTNSNAGSVEKGEDENSEDSDLQV